MLEHLSDAFEGEGGHLLGDHRLQLRGGALELEHDLIDFSLVHGLISGAASALDLLSQKGAALDDQPLDRVIDVVPHMRRTELRCQ